LASASENILDVDESQELPLPGLSFSSIIGAFGSVRRFQALRFPQSDPEEQNLGSSRHNAKQFFQKLPIIGRFHQSPPFGFVYHDVLPFERKTSAMLSSSEAMFS